MKKWWRKSESYLQPVGYSVGIGSFLLLQKLVWQASIVVAVVLIGIEGLMMLREAIVAIKQRRFGFDFIAMLALLVSVVNQEWLVGLIVTLMLSTGRTLEKYAANKAKKSLNELANRIPSKVLLWQSEGEMIEKEIGEIVVGEQICVRKGEVIPLDGSLVSDEATIDESSLTGEPYQVDRYKGDKLRSGTVNSGDVIVMKVLRVDKESTYRKIVDMVAQAQDEKTPLVRIADRFSRVFTLVTLVLAGLAYFVSGGSLDRVLSVLVIATPCPLILATPVALLGGMNVLSKKKIVLKRLAALEVLSRVKVLILDKTGTITLGKPTLSKIDILVKNYDKKRILGIAEAIERSSLHPLAKAIVEAAIKRNARKLIATDVQEKVGHGISGTVGGRRYRIQKLRSDGMLAVELWEEKKKLAVIYLKDKLKDGSEKGIKRLRKMGMKIAVFTGDKLVSAVTTLEGVVDESEIVAECTPEDKLKGVLKYRRNGQVIAMVGDGINDAPALAAADVGIVFAHAEQTAASEAADVVFLNGDLMAVIDSILVSKRTLRIVMQSIGVGIGLSILGMVFSVFGMIPAMVGAVLQEVIDLAVILNAVRASRNGR